MGCVRCELSTPYSILIPVGISGGESFEVRELAELDPFFRIRLAVGRVATPEGCFKEGAACTPRERGERKKKIQKKRPAGKNDVQEYQRKQSIDTSFSQRGGSNGG